MKKLFLLDAFALIFRAYHALANSSPRITSTGIDTNAQFGFTNTLIDLITKEKPSHIAICFDTSAPTQRTIDFADYKANRQEAPEPLIQAIPDIKAIIAGFQIPIIEYDGFEADDVIGTLAWQAAAQGIDVYMVTPDKDYGQLLTKPQVFIYKPSNRGNPPEILTAESICQKWDIQRVEQVIDMLGLMGDAVDNIPGIKGIGEKTAAKLLKEYDTLEHVLANADIIKGAVGDKIRAGKDQAILSKKLATIITDVPVNYNEDGFLYRGVIKEKLQPIFQRLEFKTLGKRLFDHDAQATNINKSSSSITTLFGDIEYNESTSPLSQTAETTQFKTIRDIQHHYHLLEKEDDILNLINLLMAQSEVCLDTETTGIHPKEAAIIGLAFSFKKHEAYYIPILETSKTDKIKKLALFEPLWQKKDILWIGQNLKYDFLVLRNYGIFIENNYFDTMVAHYVIQPEGKHNMDLMSEQHLGYSPISITSLIGKKGKNQGCLLDVPLVEVADYSAEDADITFQLKHALNPLLVSNNVNQVFYDIDNPLVHVLVDMEDHGIKIDQVFLANYAKDIEREAIEIEKNVITEAGINFNLSSPKQVGEVLFQKLQIDNGGKKTKTGQLATGEEVLIKLAKHYPIVQNILDYRELSKLLSTYILALPEMINPKTQRVHTSYSQTVAVTGRLSSNYPNLQNIPIRTTKGQGVRKAFIPQDDGWVIASADYSQIELRIIAAMSGDTNMIEAFKNDKDIHIATAAKVFGIPESAVTKEQRYQAKSVNFGLIYGQGAFGLSENLKISNKEAKSIIESYHIQFSGINRFKQNNIEFARKHGFVETLVGRKRYLSDINSQNFTIRSFAERNAINSPIQGTAADMIKMAMIKIQASLKQAGLQTKMLLQVHDELVFEIPKTELTKAKHVILEDMQNAMVLPNQVPVKAEFGYGANWLEAH
ncbi:MAG: DNA polymerase I [Alphaproteobacteria bacterium]|nr:DNA polymerase I [Alphaproteobacteria bacterium]